VTRNENLVEHQKFQREATEILRNDNIQHCRKERRKKKDNGKGKANRKKKPPRKVTKPDIPPLCQKFASRVSNQAQGKKERWNQKSGNHRLPKHASVPKIEAPTGENSPNHSSFIRPFVAATLSEHDPQLVLKGQQTCWEARRRSTRESRVEPFGLSPTFQEDCP
jgi:hypothetical protein